MLGFLKKLVTGGSRVANVAKSIFSIALPMLRGMRPAIDEVDEAFTYVENKIETGGEAADDFLDANIDKIRAVREALVDVQAWAGQGVSVCDHLEKISQEQTPDTITPEEGEETLKLLVGFKDLGNPLRNSLDKAIAAAEEAEFTDVEE